MKVLIGVDNSEYGAFAVQDYVTARHKPGDDVVLVQLCKPDELLERSNRPQNNNNSIKGNSISLNTCGVPPNILELFRQHSVNFRIVDIDGKAGAAVCDVAEKEGVSMIVLGEKASAGIGRLLIRPVYDHVLKHAKIPVRVCSNRQTHVIKRSFGGGQVTWLEPE